MMTNPDIKFYDTCSLLLAGESIFEKDEFFLLSSITLKELENIKSAYNKDSDIKYSARLLLHLLEQYQNNYEIILHKISNENPIIEKGFEINNDLMILSDALQANNRGPYIDRVVFVTNDLSLKRIANLFFGDGMIESIEEEVDTYCGYKELFLNDDELANLYQYPDQNWFDLKIGEYLIIKNEDGMIIDIRCWTGEDHRLLKYPVYNSDWFGKLRPYDTYQKLVFDSLNNNKITMIKGPAGSGKTIISLGFLMNQLEHHNLDKIIIFCNTVATADSAKLGFYPGTKNEKLLDSQIGNLLISKFGGRDGVERLIQEEKIILLPLSDIRGFDTTGMKAGVYISEAQNLNRSLIKLALQRIGEDCICIIDGDDKTQVDMIQYQGHNNGMKRVSKVYRNHDIYGEVELKIVHRSEIARIAEEI